MYTGLIELRDDLDKTMNLTRNFDLEIEKREKELDKKLADLKRHAISLHTARESIGERLHEAIGDGAAKGSGCRMHVSRSA
jgi:DNA repair ATPase RecN